MIRNVSRAWLAGPLYSLLAAPLVATCLMGFVVGATGVVEYARDGDVGDLVMSIHAPFFFPLLLYLPALYVVGPQALLAGFVGTACLLRWKNPSGCSRRVRALAIGAALGLVSALVIPWREGDWLLDPAAICLGAITGGIVSLRVANLASVQGSG